MSTAPKSLKALVALTVFVFFGCFDGDPVTGPTMDTLPTEVSYARGGKKATRDTNLTDPAPDSPTTETTVGDEAADGTIVLLDRRSPLDRDITASAVVGPKGGNVRIAGEIDVRIPWGALTEEVEITVTALAGPKVAFEILPHGLTFEKPISIWFTKSILSSVDDVFGAYYEGDPLAPVVNEIFVAFVNKRWVEIRTSHFSGYALASGSRGRFGMDSEF